MTKFGVVGFNDSLYYELLLYNIKVTALCPSSIATDMTRNFTISKEQMISTDDIVKAVNFALSLSDNACVPELLRKCKTYDLGWWCYVIITFITMLYNIAFCKYLYKNA